MATRLQLAVLLIKRLEIEAVHIGTEVRRWQFYRTVLNPIIMNSILNKNITKLKNCCLPFTLSTVFF